MKKSIISFFLTLFLLPNTYSQAPDTAWTKAYHRGTDVCQWIEETSDGGYIMVGYSRLSVNTWLDILLVRVNSSGDVLWTHTYENPTHGEEAYCVKEDYNGGFVIAGVIHHSATLRNAWIIKTDNSGDTLWTYKYGDNRNAEALNICCTSDSGYIITGFKNIPGKSGDVFLLKLDKNGKLDWVQTYGGSTHQEGCIVQQTTDGGYMVAGSDDVWGRAYDYYLIKTDEYGNLEWSKTFGGNKYDHCTSAQQTYDGGYILFGRSDSHNPNNDLAVKTNSTGDTLWTKNFRRTNDFGWSVDQTADSGFIFGGYTNNPTKLDDFWFIRTNTDGDTLWMKSVGYGDDQRGYCVLQTGDGGYILAGYSDQGGSLAQDFYVVKLQASVTGINDSHIIPYSLKLNQNYPNPFDQSTKICWEQAIPDNVVLKVFDFSGRQIGVLINKTMPAGDHEVIFNGTGLLPGVYFYQIQANGLVQTKKMMCIK
jgi:hypothetical protein